MTDCHNNGSMLKKFAKEMCTVHQTPHQFCICPEPFQLFTFHTEKKNPELKKAWERCVNRLLSEDKSKKSKTALWEANSDSRICTRHFVDGHDYPILHMGHDNIPREYQASLSLSVDFHKELNGCKETFLF